MINVTGAFLNKLSNDERDYLEKIDMTLADGTILHLTNEDIWSGSLTFDDAVGSDNSFTALGSAIVNSLTFSINNIYDEYSAYDFTEAVAHVYIGLDINGTPEYIKKGVFTVNETTYNGQIITLKMYDNMYKFDMAYTQSGLEYPASLDTIVRNACDVCGVTLASSSLNFPRKEFVVQNRPSEKATTFREVISWCATIAGCFARCNVNGYLELKWFDVEQFNAVDDVDGGMFDTQSQSRYMTGDTADGGNFNPWNTGDVRDGGTFNFTNIHNIASLYSQNVSVDDVVITQISAEVKVESEDSTSGILVFTSGTEGYGISIKGNDFLTEDNAQNVVSYLGQQIIGTKFRKANVQHSSNPTIEAGDCAYVFDTKGNRYDILVTRTCFKVGGAQTTVCGADTPMRNSASRFSESTKSYVELRERLANQKNTFEQKQEELAERIENAQGLYFTEVPQQTGGSKYYLHDKQTLGESDIQILVSDVGITVTPDGGDTWYGLTVDGQLIASILTAIGVNADWINTGQLVVRKGQDEVLFVDVDTGTVRIKADSFSLTSGETIQSIADDAASSAVVTSNNYTDTQIAATNQALSTFSQQVTADIEDLQAQIDGQIDTWYYDYAPTLSNAPASDWTTEALKEEHQGDVFIDTSTGRSYRFLKNDNVWQWKIIEDTDTALALQTARDALDLADHKRRIFVSQPTPPYDVGDLWVQGSDGDIMKCKTARASGNYNASDWEKASKYTDDSGLTNWINGDFATTISQVQGQIDGKSETWYQSADPSTNWTTTAIKTEHKGDLWYCTSSTGTYAMKYWRWSGSAWQEMKATPPTSVFNQIDGKAQIFITQPKPPYRVGDLWFNSTTSDIMTCVTKRDSGSYVASDWQKRNKYTDDTTVKAQYGTCTTAASTANKVVSLANFSLYTGARISVYFTYANSATSPTLNVNGTGAKNIYAYGSTLAANSPYNWAAKSTVEFVYNGSQWVMSDSGANANVRALDQSLTQTVIFNRLTNNGAAQGIFMQSGQLYINMSYLQTGTLKLGGANNAEGKLEVYNSSGTKIGKWDKDGAEIKGALVSESNNYNIYGQQADTVAEFQNIAPSTTSSGYSFWQVITHGTTDTREWYDPYLVPGYSISTYPVGNRTNPITRFVIAPQAQSRAGTTLYWEIPSTSNYPQVEKSAELVVKNLKRDSASAISLSDGFRFERRKANTKVVDNDIFFHIESDYIYWGHRPGSNNNNGGINLTTSGRDSTTNDLLSYSDIDRMVLKISPSIIYIGKGGSQPSIYITTSNAQINYKTVQFASTSSKRYKHNIELLHDSVLDPHRLYNLKAKQFRYNVDVPLQYQDMYGMTLPGFIAEDVAEIYPSAVIHHPEHTDDVESWDERRIIPPMLSLIQEQHEQIESLTARIEQLETLIHE